MFGIGIESEADEFGDAGTDHGLEEEQPCQDFAAGTGEKIVSHGVELLGVFGHAFAAMGDGFGVAEGDAEFAQRVFGDAGFGLVANGPFENV